MKNNIQNLSIPYNLLTGLPGDSRSSRFNGVLRGTPNNINLYKVLQEGMKRNYWDSVLTKDLTLNGTTYAAGTTYTHLIESGGIGTELTATNIVNIPSGNLEATNVQDALNEIQTQTNQQILYSAQALSGPVTTVSDLGVDVTTGTLYYVSSGEWAEVPGTKDVSGFMDYNNSSNSIPLVADTWTDVPNDGLGAFTNKLYKPNGVDEVLDTSTGYLDFSDLTLGSQILVRNDFTIVPNTNNCLLEVRYVLGQGAGEYSLKFWSERLDSGSGIEYQRVLSFPIYMGDSNTKGGPGKLQIKLSTSGTLNNAGSYIKIDLR